MSDAIFGSSSSNSNSTLAWDLIESHSNSSSTLQVGPFTSVSTNYLALIFKATLNSTVSSAGSTYYMWLMYNYVRDESAASNRLEIAGSGLGNSISAGTYVSKPIFLAMSSPENYTASDDTIHYMGVADNGYVPFNSLYAGVFYGTNISRAGYKSGSKNQLTVSLYGINIPYS